MLQSSTQNPAHSSLPSLQNAFLSSLRWESYPPLCSHNTLHKVLPEHFIQQKATCLICLPNQTTNASRRDSLGVEISKHSKIFFLLNQWKTIFPLWWYFELHLSSLPKGLEVVQSSTGSQRKPEQSAKEIISRSRLYAYVLLSPMWLPCLCFSTLTYKMKIMLVMSQIFRRIEQNNSCKVLGISCLILNNR